MDLSNVLGYTAKFTVVPHSFSDKEFIADNVEFKTKTVIDGHTASGLAGAAVGGLVVGVLLGLVTVSSLFQFPIFGIQVPRIIAKQPGEVL